MRNLTVTHDNNGKYTVEYGGEVIATIEVTKGWSCERQVVSSFEKSLSKPLLRLVLALIESIPDLAE